MQQNTLATAGLILRAQKARPHCRDLAIPDFGWTALRKAQFYRADATAARESTDWKFMVYESKFDGFRAQAIQSGGWICLRSRNDKDFNRIYPAIVEALHQMPGETVVDGEIAALDERALARGTHGGEDEAVPAVETGTGWAVRVRRVDIRWAPFL